MTVGRVFFHVKFACNYMMHTLLAITVSCLYYLQVDDIASASTGKKYTHVSFFLSKCSMN